MPDCTSSSSYGTSKSYENGRCKNNSGVIVKTCLSPRYVLPYCQARCVARFPWGVRELVL
jgi:hypothetical protein